MNMDKPAWHTIESEMDRFEAEISSLSKVTTSGDSDTPTPLPTITSVPVFVPASVRKPPSSASAASQLPRPKLTPVVISGGPQLYKNNQTRSTTPASSTPLPLPVQLGNRLIRPGLLPGSPPITPSTGHGIPAGSPPVHASNLAITNSGTSSIPSFPVPTNSSVVEIKPDVKHVIKSEESTPSTSNSSKNKKRKKKADEDGPKKKQIKHVRSAGGAIWEDPTLLDWDTKDFRIFCGDLGNDVTDEVLTRVFGRYPSFIKARVVRDKRTNKTKGYGFVSFKDPADFSKAIRELDGRYVGSRPIKLRKSMWDSRSLGQVRQRDKLQKQMLGIIKPTK